MILSCQWVIKSALHLTICKDFMSVHKDRKSIDHPMTFMSTLWHCCFSLSKNVRHSTESADTIDPVVAASTVSKTQSQLHNSAYLNALLHMISYVAGRFCGNLARLTGLQELQIGIWLDLKILKTPICYSHILPPFPLKLEAIQQLQPLTSLKILASPLLRDGLISTSIRLMQRSSQPFRRCWKSYEPLSLYTAGNTCFL